MVYCRELIPISLEEIKEQLANHELFLSRGIEDKKADFECKNFYLGMEEIKKDVIIDDALYKEYEGIFENKNLSEVNFRGADVRGLSFKGSKLDWTDFREAKRDPNQFTEKQRKSMILTEEDFKKYLEYKKMKEKVKEQEDLLKSTSDKYTKDLLAGFVEFSNALKIEEKKWLGGVLLAFWELFLLTLVLFTFLVEDSTFYLKRIVITMFLGILVGLTYFLFCCRKMEIYGKNNLLDLIAINGRIKKNIWKSVTNFKIIFLLILGSLLLFLINYLKGVKTVEVSLEVDYKYVFAVMFFVAITFLYFTIKQYSAIKSLRLDMQNRVSMLKGFQAIKADPDGSYNKGRFYDRISGVVFNNIRGGGKVDSGIVVDKVSDILEKILKIRNL